MRRILNLPAAGTCQIAAKQRLQHQDERIALTAGESLPENIRRNCPHLGDGYCHFPIVSRYSRDLMEKATILSLLACAGLCAQQVALEGTTVDAVTQAPLAGVHVSLVSLGV